MGFIQNHFSQQVEEINFLNKKMTQSYMVTPQSTKTKKAVLIQQSEQTDKPLLQRAKMFNKQSTLMPAKSKLGQVSTMQSNQIDGFLKHKTELVADPVKRQATR